MLVVLVRLNSYARKSSIACYIIGSSQVTVTCGESACEKLGKIDLGAGSGESIEVHIMDMDITVLVSLSVFLFKNIHLVEFLSADRTVLEHCAHSGVAVDVGVFPLDVAVGCIGKGDVFVNFHQPGVHLPGPGALRAVEDVSFCYIVIACLDETACQDLACQDSSLSAYSYQEDILYFTHYLVTSSIALNGQTCLQTVHPLQLV